MSLDIVIPAHDEETRIARTLRAYRAGFPQDDVRFHVALDGCDGPHRRRRARPRRRRRRGSCCTSSRSSARAAC